MKQPLFAWVARVALALACIVLLPRFYRQDRLERAQKELDHLRRTQQPLPRQIAKVEGIIELDAGTTEERKLLRSAYDLLKAQRKQCERRLETVDAELAATQDSNRLIQIRFQKGLDLYLLDRLEEAEKVLSEIAPTHLRASLLLAVILQDRQLWTESDAWYTCAMELAAARAIESWVSASMQAIDGISTNARAERRFVDAEAAYRRGIARIPEAKAYFHLQLGRHFSEGGRASKPWRNWNPRFGRHCPMSRHGNC